MPGPKKVKTQEILSALDSGKSVTEIATQFGLSENTVRYHLKKGKSSEPVAVSAVAVARQVLDSNIETTLSRTVETWWENLTLGQRLDAMLYIRSHSEGIFSQPLSRERADESFRGGTGTPGSRGY